MPFRVCRKLSYIHNRRSEIERNALLALEDLLNKQISDAQGRFPQSMLISLTRFPPLSLCPQVVIFTKLVTEDFSKISKK